VQLAVIFPPTIVRFVIVDPDPYPDPVPIPDPYA
jgi:hypothetical protein